MAKADQHAEKRAAISDAETQVVCRDAQHFVDFALQLGLGQEPSTLCRGRGTSADKRNITAAFSVARLGRLLPHLGASWLNSESIFTKLYGLRNYNEVTDASS